MGEETHYGDKAMTDEINRDRRFLGTAIGDAILWAVTIAGPAK